MKVFRPAHLRFEYRVSADDRLRQLISGAGGDSPGRWFASGAHLEAEVEVAAADLALFAAVPERGVAANALAAAPEALARLLASGVLLSDEPAHAGHAAKDAALRAAGWWGPAALAQALSAWEDVDVAAIEAGEGRRGVGRLLEENGLPPTESFSLCDAAERLPLPVPARSPVDELLGARSTCRNFEATAAVPLAHLARVLHRVFGAQASEELAPGATMLKKNSPSGGGLHPIEAYVLAQRVDGLAPGLYHYHCLAHALEPLRQLGEAEAAARARELVAGQDWFANAPVLVLMAARFARTYWKYRNHPKAWQVIQLDAGHLSQNLYLSATELGYGAFITAAINDRGAGRLFDLDGISIGAVAVCGFGKRAADGSNVELDPLGKAVR